MAETPEEPEELEEVEAEPPRIAHYLIQGVVARGHESVVYRAKDETLGRGVALKVLEDPAAADRLIDEARITSQLTHPGIAAVYQAGRDPVTDCAFVAFEWVDGATLRAHLRRGELEEEDLLRYASEIAAAVAHAHEQSLVHGDLKLDNVVLPYSGPGLKLIDFGLSSAIERFTPGEIWGTPAYMAPELFEGAPRTIASDLFALGVLLYELATRALPFGGDDDDEHAVAERLRHDRREPLDQLRPGLPTEFVELVDQLLVGEPERRGPTAAEVAQRLNQLRQSRVKSSSGKWIALIVLIALMGTGYGTRDRWLKGLTGETDRDASQSESNAPLVVPWPAHRLRLGEVRIARMAGEDPQSAPIAADDPRAAYQKQLAQTLAVFLSPRDPGSALLADSSTSTSPAELGPSAWLVAEVEFLSESSDARVTYRLSPDRSGSGSFVDPPALIVTKDATEDGVTLSEGARFQIEGDDPVGVGLSGIRVLRQQGTDASFGEPRSSESPPNVSEPTAKPPTGSGPESRRWTWRNGWPTTLVDKANPIRAFIAGVEMTQTFEGWSEAIALFERAQADGSFLEAKAWRAALLLARGHDDRPGKLAVELRDALLSRRVAEPDRSELTGCVIDTLGQPTVDRYRRWDAPHRLALAFNDALDAREPALTDRILRERFEERRFNRELLYRQCQLFVRSGDLDPARSAFESYRLLGDQIGVRAGAGAAGGEANWRESFLAWRLDNAESSQEMRELKLMRWLLPRSRQPAYFLVMPLVISQFDRSELAAVADRQYGLVEAESVRCLRWLLLGELDAARSIAATLSPPLDRGLGHRLLAAIEALAGNRSETRAALENARVVDPHHPAARFLEEYLEASPYEIQVESGDESAFRRWRRRFSLLAQARTIRQEGDPSQSLELLDSVRWVDSEFRVLDWPELGFLVWLERVQGIRDVGGVDRAKSEFNRFRAWWPRDRAPESRVSREANRIELLLDGAQ